MFYVGVVWSNSIRTMSGTSHAKGIVVEKIGIEAKQLLDILLSQAKQRHCEFGVRHSYLFTMDANHSLHFSPLWYGNFQFFWTFYLSFFNLLCKEQLLQVKINHDSHFIFRPNSAIRKCCRGELTSFFGSMAYSLAFICNLFSVSDLLRCSVDQEWQEDCSLCSKASQCDRFDILWPKLLFWKPLTRDGCLNFIDENDEVLISGFGRRGHAAAS